MWNSTWDQSAGVPETDPVWLGNWSLGYFVNDTAIVYELWNTIWTSTYNVSYESTYNSTYDLWAYNQTTPATDYVDVEITNINDSTNIENLGFVTGSHTVDTSYIYTHLGNLTDDILAGLNHTAIVYELWNSAWVSIYNASYDLWAYNQTELDTDSKYTHLSNLTDDIGNYNSTYDLWAYNQTELGTYNSTYDADLNNTFNDTYAFWAFNQTELGTYNSTYDTDLNNTFNSTYDADLNVSFNATYDLWAYNQSTAVFDMYNSTWDSPGVGDGSYNATYELWAYNQTTPAEDYADVEITNINDSDNIVNLGFVTGSHTVDTSYIYTHLSNFTDDKGVFNLTYESTYNATYDLWSYNQTSAGYSLFEPISEVHFNATTLNITCFDAACDWYTNASDSCMYWPSGGKDCGAA